MLRDVHFKHSYSSGYDEPKDFFTEALIESSTFDLGLGFFSSSGIRSLHMVLPYSLRMEAKCVLL